MTEQSESGQSEVGSSICDVIAALYLNGPTKSVAAQRAILDTLAHEHETAPTHGNGAGDERKRLPFSAEDIAAHSGIKPGSPILWRLSPPKYWGLVDASPQPVARVLLRYEDIQERYIAGVCAAIARLADRFEPAFGALHFRWTNPTPEHIASMQNISAKALEYSRYGIPGIFAWTWFGSALTERLGGVTCLQGFGGSLRSWGGVFLPLTEQPWATPFQELRACQIAVATRLRESGLFIDYSRTVPSQGVKWTPLAGARPTAGS
ncbi:MAG TPA: hypothetical protein VKU01_24605 [Bryobacteraceae bacterium]|nr:hypothetical protein [Bryobacteraceae bacterium]